MHVNAEFRKQINTSLKILTMTYICTYECKFLNDGKCNYSEKLNFLQAQTCNVHLCHHLAKGENHFEQQP